MSDLKKRFLKFSNIYLQVIGVLILGCIAGLLLWFHHANSMQAISAMVAQVRFEGEYRIEDGPWQNITEGEHIPATKGDVTLRGNFHMLTPDGEYVGIYRDEIPVAFYTDHINLTIREGENEPVTLDIENPFLGDSFCGMLWSSYLLTSESEEMIEIRIHNPHRFGNETAVDEMLSNLALWAGIDFERNTMNVGQNQRNTGMLFMIISFVLLGSALFSALLHIPNNRIIWLLGSTIFPAGIYLLYSATGVSFWSESIAANTSILGFSMMFYMLFISAITTHLLKKTKRIGYVTTTIMGVIDGVYFLLPMLANIHFYNTLLPWVITQSIGNAVMIVCLCKEHKSATNRNRWAHAGMAMLMIAFEADAIATALGTWKGGMISQYVFCVLLIATLVVVLRIIPESINAAERAKNLERQRILLEAELKENRIAIMLSQIQPHFIYNTLGTIERMCLKDPQKAFELVRNFSLYLRGNFSELDSVTPIRFAEELKHVEYYVNIEKVRFPDMNIEYDVETTDFVLPALSVQPLVENAIKHGLMRLESGGTVVIRSYETSRHFCVEVKDDGVGFDPTVPVEEKKHVGLRNIRGRLKAMVNGELVIESQIGSGTRAVIMIPKE